MVSQLVKAPEAGELRGYKMLIGGEWVDALSGRTFESVNPYTGKAWATVPQAGDEDVDRAVTAARTAFDEGPWSTMTGTERARLLRRLAELIADNAEEIATVETTDNGKLLREMGGQLKALPEWYYYFAGAADKVQGETIPSDKPEFLRLHQARAYRGGWGDHAVELAAALLTFKLAPALAAGCTFVVKTAEQTPASTLEFARLFDEAGFPPGVFNVVTGYGPTTGSALGAHPGVDKVAFTGSTETGKQVMKDAADHLAKVTFELGGKSPQIVFEDADLEAVANGVVSGIFAATGQTCIAGSRLFVQEAGHDELVERLAEQAEAIRLGNPLEAETEMGPVAFLEQLEKVQGYIEIGTEEGATLVHGGTRPNTPELRDGYFIEPTILAGVDQRDDGSRARRSSARSSPSSASGARKSSSARQTTRPTGWPPACGPRTSSGPIGSPTRSGPGRSGSTPTAPSRSHALRRLQAERPRSGERPGVGARVHPDQGRLDRTLRPDPRPFHAGLKRARRRRTGRNHGCRAAGEAPGRLAGPRARGPHSRPLRDQDHGRVRGRGDKGRAAGGGGSLAYLALRGPSYQHVPVVVTPVAQQEAGHARYRASGRPGSGPRLAAQCDILVENFKPGTLESWGSDGTYSTS